MTTKKRDPKSIMVMRCAEPYALRLRAHLTTVFGPKVTGMYAPIADHPGLVLLRLRFPESIADGVIHSATEWIKARAPEGKELVVDERGRR